MTTTRIERLTRQALGTQAPASPDADRPASCAAPALLIIAVTAVLLLSGCAFNPGQPDQTDATNTSGLGHTLVLGNMLFTGP